MLTSRRLNNLREMRRYGIGRLLLLARRDFVNRLAAKMGAQDEPWLSWAGSRLLPYIDLEGIRSTELARRVGISKQAVAKVVKEMEEAGYLERSDDEADGRAYLIKFTESGIEYLVRMHEAIARVERDYEREFGAERIGALKEVLAGIAYGEEASPGEEPARVTAASARRSAAR